MSLNSTVLFDRPQHEIASLIVDRISQSTSTSIVTGFATPGGLAAIAASIRSQPTRLKTLVVGAATYPGFEALDELIDADVPRANLFVHLGHTCATRSRKHPYARYHPMLHSKIYYMESGSRACAFIGSNNVTAFALTGLNGEAAIMLEGPADSPEFVKVRRHIEAARDQAVAYSPAMKEAYAWWTREFLDGLKAEMRVPQDWTTVRTILLFASAATHDRPKTGDELYFEIPADIEQIESLKTETHLFLFNRLPTDPLQALASTQLAEAKYTCKTLGAENRQGNKEVIADWRIDETPRPILRRVSGATFRPNTPARKQQVRAEVEAPSIPAYEYSFERERAAWEPVFSEDDEELLPTPAVGDEIVLTEARGDFRDLPVWKLVEQLVRQQASASEKDQAALLLASPESGSFILVALRRRRRNRIRDQEKEH
jgi:hypothetical protein